MKNTTYFFTFTLALVTLLSCSKKEPEEDPQRAWFTAEDWNAMQRADFGCTGITGDYFISANLDGVPFCMDAEGGSDTSYFAKSISVITGSNGTLLNGHFYKFAVGDKDCFAARLSRFTDLELYHNRELEDEVAFEVVYATSVERPANVIIDSLFKIGQDYPMYKQGVIGGDPTGRFNLAINVYYDITPMVFGGLTCASIDFQSMGEQPSEAYLRCVAISKEEFDTYYLYDITFEFRGDLFLSRDKNLWCTLTDGKMRGKYKIAK
jgi:hypothetical protein